MIDKARRAVATHWRNALPLVILVAAVLLSMLCAITALTLFVAGGLQ